MPVRSDHFWGFIALMIVGAVLMNALPDNLRFIPVIVMLAGFGVLIKGLALGMHQTAQSQGGYGSCLGNMAKGLGLLMLTCFLFGLVSKGCR
jgi:hypothetical protein